MAPTNVHPQLKPLVTLRNLLMRDAVTDEFLMKHLTGGPNRAGTGPLLDEAQPYDANMCTQTQSRCRAALENLKMIQKKFGASTYYLCLFTCSMSALSKNLVQSGLWDALEKWPDRDCLPENFTEKACGVIEEYREKRRRADGGPASRQKRRRSPERVTNTSKRARGRDGQPVQPESKESEGDIGYERSLSVSYSHSPGTPEANKRLQWLEASRTSGSDALPYSSPRCSLVPTSRRAQPVPQVVAHSGKETDSNDSEDDNDDKPDNEDHDNNYDGYNNKDPYATADAVAEVQECSSSSNNQCNDDAKDRSFLASHGTFSQHAQQLMPQIHNNQHNVSHGSLQAPVQFHPQPQLGVSQESHFVTPQVATQNNMKGYVIRKEHLYEVLAHYKGPIKLVVPLMPGYRPFINVEITETEAKKFWSARHRFM